nr:hypothetical protein [Tanacetum cinerariifolium]
MGAGGVTTKAFISLKDFSKRLIRISNLSSREAAICWSSKELEGEEDERGAFVLTLESVTRLHEYLTLDLLSIIAKPSRECHERTEDTKKEIRSGRAEYRGRTGPMTADTKKENMTGHCGASRKDGAYDSGYQKRKYVRTCGVSRKDMTYDRGHQKGKYVRTCEASRKDGAYDHGYQKRKYARTCIDKYANKG